jgi:hypothetical protein
MTKIQQIKTASDQLVALDPTNEKVPRLVEAIHAHVNLLASEEPPAVDMAALKAELDQLHQAALLPAQNYRRIANICHELTRIHHLASQPQNAAVRPQFASLITKVAGIFSEIDTVEDLDKPLEEIEKAVHKLYGPDQSKNSMPYFERRGKGHHSE